MVLPVGIGTLVTPLLHVLDVLGLPAIQVGGADEGDVDTEVTVNTGATDANEDTKGGRGPTGT